MDLPHDRAIELPFVDAPALTQRGEVADEKQQVADEPNRPAP